MSDTPATPIPPPPAPLFHGPVSEPGFFRMLFDFFRSNGLMARSILLTALTLLLTLPLGMVGNIISDRQTHEDEAKKSIVKSWGGAQTFGGPELLLPYTQVTDKAMHTYNVALLPQKLTIDAEVLPSQRRRGLFAVTLYNTTLNVSAEFRTKDLEEFLTGKRIADWGAAHLVVGITEPLSVDATSVTVDGRNYDWVPSGTNDMSSIKAALHGLDIRDKEAMTVTFRLSFSGSKSLSFLPIGKHTDVSVASSWRSPSFTGRFLPVTQSIDKDGMRANWSMSHLGRRYGQVWDWNDQSAATPPNSDVLLESAFGFTMINPVDAYRETDRAIKYAILITGLTFAVSQLFELATGTRPLIAQYGLIGLSLCVFYLLLLSFSEQIGFAPAYVVSAAAVVVQATAYNWAVYRRPPLALAFGVILAGLFGGLYTLLQLEEVALLSGSVLLFVVLSIAMWFTRNLHRTQAA